MRFGITILTMFSVSMAFAQLEIITIDSKTKNPNEPAIALHPKRGAIVGASNVDNIYHTKDKGLNWSHSNATSALGVYGDPVLNYADTTLFFTHLSKTKGKKYGDWFDRIVVQKVESVSPWVEQSYSVGYNQDKMQDKPWMSSDHHSKYEGNVYVTWTQFDKYDSHDSSDRSRIQFSYYNAEIDSFSNEITISDTTGDCIDGDNTLEGATTAVGSNGEIIAVWAGFEKLFIDKSYNGGLTWGRDIVLARQPEGWDMKMPNIFRANGMPFIASNPSKNHFVVCWADELNGNADIWLKHSIDGGNTWSKRLRVNQDTTQSHQYFPNIVFHQPTESYFIAYWDQRHSSKNLFNDIYLAQFKIGEGIKEFRLTKKSSPLPGPTFFYGDYIDIDANDSNIAVIYPTFSAITKKSSIELAHGKISDIASNYSSKSSATTIEEAGRVKLYVNVQAPYLIKGRYISGYWFQRKVYPFRQKYEGSNINFDEEIASYPLAVKHRIKYKLKPLN